MQITREEVEYVANLARLKLNDQEKELFTRQLDSILKYMEKLNELDTSQVPPTSHVQPLRNVMREDKAEDSHLQEDMMANAPEREDNFYVVPRVIE
jgi:aspartyl-tRNA(Asn)/glutamyl-tRNA(Gln) amidotransferase subunit C